MYDALFDVETETLTEEHVRFKGKAELIIETQDNGVVSNFLVAEGSLVSAGTLLALIVDDESNLDAVNALVSTDPSAFDKCEDFTWQAYLK